MFDDYLRTGRGAAGETFRPFDALATTTQYVDGKPRSTACASFLASRGIELPEGAPCDPPGADTVHGLGNRKNDLVLELIGECGVEVFEGSVRFVRAVARGRVAHARWCPRAPTPRRAARRPASPTSSTCASTAWCAERTPARQAGTRHVPGRRPRRSGVAAAAGGGLRGRPRRGRGRARRRLRLRGRRRPVGQAEALRAHGADVVVSDLAELLGRRA